VKTGLALEAVFTAMHWAEHPAIVRGGPWCRAKLPSADLRALHQLSEALEGKATLAARVAAVHSVAAELAHDGSLNMHLRCVCFRCKATFQKCSCKLFRRKDAQIVRLPAARKSGKHKSRVGAIKSGAHGKSVSSGKQKSRVGAMKSGASGRSGRHKARVGSKVINRPYGASGSQSSGGSAQVCCAATGPCPQALRHCLRGTFGIERARRARRAVPSLQKRTVFLAFCDCLLVCCCSCSAVTNTSPSTTSSTSTSTRSTTTNSSRAPKKFTTSYYYYYYIATATAAATTTTTTTTTTTPTTTTTTTNY